LGIGDWGLGIGDWAQSPIPNPQSPIPNPQSPFILNLNLNYLIVKYIVKLNNNYFNYTTFISKQIYFEKK
jgi:hypothetical protein